MYKQLHRRNIYFYPERRDCSWLKMTLHTKLSHTERMDPRVATCLQGGGHTRGRGGRTDGWTWAMGEIPERGSQTHVDWIHLDPDPSAESNTQCCGGDKNIVSLSVLCAVRMVKKSQASPRSPTVHSQVLC